MSRDAAGATELASAVAADAAARGPGRYESLAGAVVGLARSVGPSRAAVVVVAG